MRHSLKQLFQFVWSRGTPRRICASATSQSRLSHWFCFTFFKEAVKTFGTLNSSERRVWKPLERVPGTLQSDHSSIVQTFKPLIKCTGCRHELSKPEESLVIAKVGCVRSAWERGALMPDRNPPGSWIFQHRICGVASTRTGVRKQVVADICSALRPPDPSLRTLPPPRPKPDCWIVSRCSFFKTAWILSALPFTAWGAPTPKVERRVDTAALPNLPGAQIKRSNVVWLCC